MDGRPLLHLILLKKEFTFEASPPQGLPFLQELYTKIGKIGKSVADFAPHSRIA